MGNHSRKDQWQIQGRGPGGGPPRPLVFDQNEARRADKKILETISNRNFIPAQHTVMTCNCTYQGHPLQEAEKNDLWSFLARVQDRIRSFMGRQSLIWPKRRFPAKQGTLSGVLSRKKYRLFSFTTGGKTAFIGVTVVFIVAHK